MLTIPQRVEKKTTMPLAFFSPSLSCLKKAFSVQVCCKVLAQLFTVENSYNFANNFTSNSSNYTISNSSKLNLAETCI